MFKYILEQKKKDLKTNDDKKAMDVMYVLTTKKFMDSENEDAQKLKQEIENELKEIMSGKKTEVPSDAVDVDRIYTPGYEPGTGRPLDKDGKVIPSEPEPSTARESVLREKQGRYIARIKFRNLLNDFGEEVNVDN